MLVIIISMCLKKFICWLFNVNYHDVIQAEKWRDMNAAVDAAKKKKDDDLYAQLFTSDDRFRYIPGDTTINTAELDKYYVTAEDQGFVLAEAILPNKQN